MPLSPAPRLLGILPDKGDRVDLDIDNQCLWVRNQAIALTPKAFQMFHYLALHEGQIVSPRDLRLSLWSDTFVEPSNVKKYILEIRKALGDNPKEPRFIETLHRRGYRFLPTVRAVAPPLPPRNSPSRPPSPFVGRQAQLDELEQRFAKAEHGECQIVFVSGQPGIGKSTLIQKFLQWLSTNHKACSGFARCHDGEGAKELYEPCLDTLENLCESDPTGDIARSLAEHAPSWLPHLSACLFRKESRPGQRISHEQKSRRTMSGEMIRALCVIAQTTPIVLVIEDLQWADPATIAFLNDLARRTVSAKLMIVATLQTPLLAADKYPLNKMVDDLSCYSLATVIPLEPLLRRDIEAWLVQLAPHGRPNLRLAEILWESSGGHPFIMRATLDDMAAQGLCQHGGKEWCISSDINVAGIPDRVRRFVELQLGRLPKEELELLEAASVAGVHFLVAEVEAALDADPDSVDIRITRLIEANYFVRDRESNSVTAGQSLQCEFVLTSFREIIYDRIPSRRKREMHHRIAAWLETQFRRPDPDVSCSIAYHFQKARDWTKAVRYILLSSEPVLQGVIFEELRQLVRLEQSPAIPFSVPEQQKTYSGKSALKRDINVT